MSPDDNKARARRILEEVINQNDMAVAAELFAADYVDHAAPPGVPPGRAGLAAYFGAFHAAFPDLHYHLEDEIAEGDRVVQRASVHATMQGDFQGMPATGKTGNWTEMHVSRFANGKLVEHWAVIDLVAMMVSLGVMPPPGG